MKPFQEFLEQYETVAAKAMSTNSIALKNKLLAYNRVLHSKLILDKQPNPQELEGQKAMKELVAQRYLADYGDCTAEHCRRLRDGAMEREIEGWDLTY